MKKVYFLMIQNVCGCDEEECVHPTHVISKITLSKRKAEKWLKELKETGDKWAYVDEKVLS